MKKVAEKAVVLLSGGLDSATVLAMARDRSFHCHAITFDYGQRHRVELESAKAVAKSMNVHEHVFMQIDLRAFGKSALTADIPVPKDQPPPSTKVSPINRDIESTIPITYVPARNTIFLSFALAYAEVLNAVDIFIGVNAVDYSGYPDCRPAFIESFERTANLATRIAVEGRPVRLHAPLIHLTKAQIIQRGLALSVDYGLTSSCYDPDLTSGKPCGHCDSCLLRAQGFATAGIADPLFKSA